MERDLEKEDLSEQDEEKGTGQGHVKVMEQDQVKGTERDQVEGDLVEQDGVRSNRGGSVSDGTSLDRKL